MIDKETEVKRLLNEFDSKYSVSISDTEQNINDIAERIVKLFAIPVVNGWHLFSERKPPIGKYLDIEWDDGTVNESIRYDGFNPSLNITPTKWRACR
jgi:hypothetical protein